MGKVALARNKQWAMDLAAELHRLVGARADEELPAVEVATVTHIKPQVLIQPTDGPVVYGQDDVIWGVDRKSLKVNDTVLLTRDPSDNPIVAAVLDGDDPDPTKHVKGRALVKKVDAMHAQSRFWKAPVSTLDGLNLATTDADGTVRLVLSSGGMYRWRASTDTWVAIGGGGGGASAFSDLTGSLAAAQVVDGSLPLSKLSTDPLARANHTGSQLASTISDFSTAVGALSYTEGEVDTLLALKAPLASPALTGAPTAPTVAITTNNTGIATTAAVTTALTGYSLTTHTHPASDITDFSAAADARITLQKGAASGLASLDGGGKVPASQLPSSLMEYQGNWNASTNTPTLADGTAANAGNVYRVSVAGTQNLGSGAITFDVGDYAVANAVGTWEKSDTTDAVASFNGRTGAVVPVANDYAVADVNGLTSQLALKAPITSPTFLTSAFAPTVAIGAGTNIATIGAVNTALGSYLPTATAASTYAPLVSPALTGVPTAPTAVGGTNTTQLASTAFVTSAVSTAGGSYQPLDADLTTIAGLTATTDSFMQAKAGAWAARTIAQVKTDLAITNVDNTSDAAKPVSTAQQTALDAKVAKAGDTMSGDLVIAPATAGTPFLTKLSGDTQAFRFKVTSYAPAGSDLGTRITLGHGTTASTEAYLYLRAANTIGVSTTLYANTSIVAGGDSTLSASGLDLNNGSGALNFGASWFGLPRINFLGLAESGVSEFLRARRNGDADYRWIAGLDSVSQRPMLQFGGGAAAADWQMTRTAANEVTIAAGDVLKLDTRPAATSDTTVATTAFVKSQKIHDLALPTASTPMNAQKLTGLAAGTVAGDSLRYEQVVGLYALLASSPTFTGEVVSNAGFVGVLPATTSLAFYMKVGAEATDRFRMLTSGTMTWGDGTNPGDTNLYRSAANTLKTDDNLHVVGAIHREAATLNDYALTASTSADTSLWPTFDARIGGKLEWGVGGATAPDVSLARTAANILAMGAGDKLQQNAAPTAEDDLTNKTYVDSLIESATEDLADIYHNHDERYHKSTTDASLTVKGITKLSVTPASSGNGGAPITLRPDSTISAAMVSSNYLDVDDTETYPATPDTGNFNYGGSSGDNILYGMPNSTLGLEVIESIAAYVYVGGGRNYNVELRTGATVLASNTWSFGANAWHALTYTGSLTQAQFDDLRVYLIASGGSGNHFIYAVQAKVVFAPVGPANPVAVGDNDPRMTDARTPTAHAPTHRLGGTDALKIHELALPTAAVPMNAQKFTGLAAGTAAGDSLRYEQLIGAYSTPADILALVEDAVEDLADIYHNHDGRYISADFLALSVSTYAYKVGGTLVPRLYTSTSAAGTAGTVEVQFIQTASTPADGLATVNGGTFTITGGTGTTDPLAWNASAGVVGAALAVLGLSVTVARSTYGGGLSTEYYRWTVTWTVNGDQPALTVNYANLTYTANSPVWWVYAPNVTHGTVTMRLEGSSSIATYDFNATNADIQTALTPLLGACVVTGTPPDRIITITSTADTKRLWADGTGLRGRSGARALLTPQYCDVAGLTSHGFSTFRRQGFFENGAGLSFTSSASQLYMYADPDVLSSSNPYVNPGDINFAGYYDSNTSAGAHDAAEYFMWWRMSMAGTVAGSPVANLLLQNNAGTTVLSISDTGVTTFSEQAKQARLPLAGVDLTNKTYVDSLIESATEDLVDIYHNHDTRYLKLSGGTVTGSIFGKYLEVEDFGYLSFIEPYGLGSNNGTLASYLDPNRLVFGLSGTAGDVILTRTAANELTLATGDVLKLDTRPAGTNDTTAANTAFVQAAVAAGGGSGGTSTDFAFFLGLM